MQDFLEKISTNLKEFFENLDPARRVGLIAVFAVIVVGIIGLVYWASNTRYDVAYTDLNKEDSAKVARLLEEKSISYIVSDNGKTIKIPEDQIEIFRIELAKKGVSFSGTVGYEVFDNQSFGTTNFVQRVNKQRALEGELVRTIKHIKGVKRARVHLNIPESSPFVSEKKPPSASVVLELNNRVTMTNDEIKGVAMLVSSSVEGMRLEDVVILDSRGKKLTQNIGDPMTAYTANRIALEAKINGQYEKQVEDILTKVVGAGKVVAKVNVSMDFTESISTRTEYDNENTAVAGEVKNTEKFEGSRPSPQGIPGARSNLPGEQPQPGIPETKSDTDRNLITRNYKIPSKVTRSKNPVASVSQISAAVMVDGKYVPILGENGQPLLNEEGMAKTQYQPWSEADLANFQAIVTSALGLDNQRGDILTIKNMEFIKEDLSRADALLRQQENRELIRNIVKYLAIGLAITLFFFILVRPFIQWITENTIESVEDFLPKTIEELEKVQANQKLPGLEDALPQIEETLNPEKIEGNMLKEKIISLVEGNPSKAAQIVHEMIHSTETEKSIA